VDKFLYQCELIYDIHIYIYTGNVFSAIACHGLHAMQLCNWMHLSLLSYDVSIHTLKI